ncbi:SDR family NAD(P)-dependent oxidoreductase [Nocardioides panzhihuensis]|uniref:NAD(P)-dependent dehydrogenase (Short-subunit alcohol dehydrogenase family) n=1 Tax=Nocardioides panzhihuensis TaxID=860243 RepID=A0A7Z0DS63_9ACTN|nr:SDR family oxidoreductase [Nocardioides panzhihuensis]NYI80386.1 NAD(P)-dependent dehydrogenase (short-subunit alcohol dehydrogenase family) [Nocardioides panzhihuensis]
MEEIDFARLGPAKGTKVVVIGGHGGIGAALSSRAAEAGAEVVALDTRRAIEENGEIAGVVNAEIDVLDEASIAAAAATVRERWGEIDAMVYVSGVGDPDTPTLDYPVERWDKVHAVNLRGAFLATQAFVPLVSKKGTGSLIFIGSTVAVQPPPGLSAYSASKAGVVAFAKSVAKELAPDVRVNVVSPGITETAFLAGGSGQGQGPQEISGESWFGEEAYQRRLAMILQRRLANPDDIVAPTLFLLGPGARYITGQTLHVNGGLYLP